MSSDEVYRSRERQATFRLTDVDTIGSRMTHVSQWNWKERVGQLADVVKATTRERHLLTAYCQAVLAYEDTSDVRERFFTRGVGFNVSDFYEGLLSQVRLDTVLEMTRTYQTVQEMNLPVYPDEERLRKGTEAVRWYESDFDISEAALLHFLEHEETRARVQKQLQGLRKVDSEIRRELKPRRPRK